jgi:hypothetical protein
MVEVKKCFRYIWKQMKIKDIQTAVKNKYKNDDGPAKIYRDLAEVLSLQTIKLWIKMMNNTIVLSISHTLLVVWVSLEGKMVSNSTEIDGNWKIGDWNNFFKKDCAANSAPIPFLFFLKVVDQGKNYHSSLQKTEHNLL